MLDLTDVAMEPPVQLRPSFGSAKPSTAREKASGFPRTDGVTTTSAPRDLRSSTVSSPGGLRAGQHTA